MSEDTRRVPLITVVIPTRERAETLRYTLESVSAQTYDRLEILVADNASADGTREVVESLHDSRIRYVNSGTRVSMSENWEFALTHASGKYLTIIGDDDALVPGAIDRLVDDIDESDDVYFWPKHTYVWPSQDRSAYVETLSAETARSVLDLGRLARFVLRMGGWRYSLLPSMYHSLVSRVIPDALRQRYGRVYHSTEPDVFMMMAIPALARRAVNVGYSVSVHGRSPKSNGWAFTGTGKPEGLRRFLAEYGDYKLHPTLYPGVPMLANITPDTLLRARDMFADYYHGYPFGYDAMWAYACREATIFNFDLTPLDVLRKRGEIERYHHVNIARFLAYLGFQLLIEKRARRRRRARTEREAPPNILAFVRELDASGRQARGFFAETR